MKKIYTSATKLTLLAIVVSLIALTFTGKLDPKVFETVAIMVFSFYFGQKVKSIE